MATIRAYTTIEQSRKLAEILPLESADMEWINDDGLGEPFPFVGRTNDDERLVCWSLAALLNVFPKSAQLEKGNVTELYRVTLPVELEASDWHIEPLDACYEVIIRLHELNLL